MLHIKKTLVHPKANEEKRTMFKNKIAKYYNEPKIVVTKLHIKHHQNQRNFLLLENYAAKKKDTILKWKLAHLEM